MQLCFFSVSLSLSLFLTDLWVIAGKERVEPMLGSGTAELIGKLAVMSKSQQTATWFTLFF